METTIQPPPCIQLREFDPLLDYQIVKGWWEMQGIEPIQACALTSSGVFATLDGEDIACGWLYVNNRSPVAYMENVVVNPDSSDSGNAVKLIADYFRVEAEEIGKLLEVNSPFAGTNSLFDGGTVAIRDEKGHEFVDSVEVEIARIGKTHEADLPLTHKFTPGMYIREIFIPAGTLLTSKIHLTEHPYVISKGDISVWTKEAGSVRLRAPFSGITKPRTRRILFAHDDTIWTTFHATTETDVEKIENTITETRVSHLMGRSVK